MTRPGTLAALVVGGFLAAPAAAGAEVDPSSISTDAQISAEAVDGGGPSSDFDQDSLSDFSEFLRSVRARDRNADSGRLGEANVTQDTEVLTEGNDVLGANMSAIADARFNDPNPNDGFVPSSEGNSTLTIDFAVVDEPVEYSLTGSIGASVPPDNSCASASLIGDLGSASALSCPGPGASLPIDITGTLDPGSHGLEVRVGAEAFGDISAATSATAIAEYDLKLRFCTIVAEPNTSTLGTPDDDVICGTPGDDNALSGAGGNDRIFGLGGKDLIFGGNGDDKLDGGDGDDVTIYGGPGDDQIDAGPGNDGDIATDDVVGGGPGDDEIDGGPGNDALAGRCAEDLQGTPSPVCPGDPVTPGESDFDEINGGTGNDQLLGDLDTNKISGGDGNDVAASGEGGTTLLGKGNDEAVGGPLRDEIDGGPGDDGLAGGLGLTGGGASDTITGGPGDDLLDGDKGNDDLFGDAGSDKITGGDNNDCLVGGSRKDDLEAGTGDDTIIAKDGGRDTGSGGPGPDEGRFDGADNIGSVAVRNFSGGC